ncbi:MAG: sulfite dehydrogenase [Gammaproteobacteria bacterium]
MNTDSSWEDAPEVAGNGLLDRRLFFGRALGALSLLHAAPLMAATRPTEPWMRVPGAPFRNYGTPSPHEASLVRWISAPPDIPQNGVSWTPLHELDGMLTPSGLHFERHHNGVPAIDPAQHTLVIHGRVQRPLTFDVSALRRYPRISRVLAIECGGNSNAGWNPQPIQTAAGYFHGLVSCSEWTGVPLSLLLEEAGLQSDARWCVAEGADAFGMTVSLPREKLLDDCFLALFQNGEPIRPEQGYPLRLIVPGWEGVTHVKWLRSLEATDTPVMARNETARYTELQPDGRARMFTFRMPVKSLLTLPSAGMRLPAPGVYELSGLAWTGHGRIVRVEVSADGGQSWADAALNDPILPCAFTRFRIPWRWRGDPAVLQSRAIDEAGERQPTRPDLIAARGRHGYFHYNAIVSWQVDADGTVSHVYPDTGHADAPVGTVDPMEAPWE